MRYIPDNIINHPAGTIFTNVEGERTMAKINTEERRNLNKRMKTWWQFIKKHDIDPRISTNDFNLFNDRETLVFRKKPLIKPQRTDILPYIIYNDRDFKRFELIMELIFNNKFEGREDFKEKLKLLIENDKKNQQSKISD